MSDEKLNEICMEMGMAMTPRAWSILRAAFAEHEAEVTARITAQINGAIGIKEALKP